MAKVEFFMYWTLCGKQTVDLPEDVDPTDRIAIYRYLCDHLEEIPIPNEGEMLDLSPDVDSGDPIYVDGKRIR